MEKGEIVAEGAAMGAAGSFAKSAPVAVGAGVSGLNFFGISLPDLVPLLTCVYLAVMILHTLWKWCAECIAHYKSSKCQCEKCNEDAD